VTQYSVLTYKMAIALRPHICDVTSPYVLIGVQTTHATLLFPGFRRFAP